MTLLQELVQSLLDTIVMNRKFSILRTEGSLKALEEVHDMDMLVVQLQEALLTQKTMD